MIKPFATDQPTWARIWPYNELYGYCIEMFDAKNRRVGVRWWHHLSDCHEWMKNEGVTRLQQV